MAIILDGKNLAAKIRESLKNKIALKNEKPVLAAILVGDDPASHTYVSMKQKACEAAGIESILVKLPAETTTEELLAKISELNKDPKVNGILLQHPVPEQIDERKAFDLIDRQKDVDGVTSDSFGKLSMSVKTHMPCTPLGMVLLLKHYNIDVTGMDVVVVGRSPILGKPMAMMLTEMDATVTLCHSRTKNLPDIISRADLVVGAVGKPEFIRGEWIKKGAILLDAGYNPGNVGDIELSTAAEISSHYTPVPGGVGPMTIAVLLLQTYYSFTGKFIPELKNTDLKNDIL